MRSRLAFRLLVGTTSLVLAVIAGGSVASAALVDLGAVRAERLSASGVIGQVTGEQPPGQVGSSFAFELTVDGDAGRLEAFRIDGMETGLVPFSLDVLRDPSAGVLTLQGSDDTFPFVFEFRLAASEGGPAQVQFGSACPGCLIAVPRSDLFGEVQRFEVTAVPETAALWLLAFGGSLVGLRRWRS